MNVGSVGRPGLLESNEPGLMRQLGATALPEQPLDSSG
jgi:hypothetical protein